MHPSYPADWQSIHHPNLPALAAPFAPFPCLKSVRMRVPIQSSSAHSHPSTTLTRASAVQCTQSHFQVHIDKVFMCLCVYVLFWFFLENRSDGILCIRFVIMASMGYIYVYIYIYIYIYEKKKKKKYPFLHLCCAVDQERYHVKRGWPAPVHPAAFSSSHRQSFICSCVYVLFCFFLRAIDQMGFYAFGL